MCPLGIFASGWEPDRKKEKKKNQSLLRTYYTPGTMQGIDKYNNNNTNISLKALIIIRKRIIKASDIYITFFANYYSVILLY